MGAVCVQKSLRTHISHGEAHWSFPPPMYIKINSDAAFVEGETLIAEGRSFSSLTRM